MKLWIKAFLTSLPGALKIINEEWTYSMIGDVISCSP
jgi:hypothetical protein